MKRNGSRGFARLAGLVLAAAVAATALAGGVEYYRPGSGKSDKSSTRSGKVETYKPGSTDRGRTSDRDPYYRPTTPQGRSLGRPYTAGRGYPWDRLAALQMEEIALKWKFYGLFSKGSYDPDEVAALGRQLERLEREKARLNRELATYKGTGPYGSGAPDYYRYGDDKRPRKPAVDYYRRD